MKDVLNERKHILNNGTIWLNLMPPRPKKPSEKAKASNALLEAISFLSAITKEEGAPQDTHILLGYKTATASNGVLSAGIIIEDDIFCAPNASIFRKALSKCGQGYTLSIDGTRIIVKSGGFKANVPCIDPGLLLSPNPDKPIIDIDDRLKEAFKVAEIIKPEYDGQRIELVAFLLNGQSIITTDGKLIIECWHGLDMPTLAIPKALTSIIVNNPRKLVKFGFSHSSITFFFEDRSWIKSQLYDKPYPVEAVLSVLSRTSNPMPLPPDFYKALDAVAPFSENGTIHFEREMLCSHRTTEAGATHEVKGLPKGPIYTAKYLSLIKPFVEKIDFTVNANGVGKDGGYLMFFFGKNVRGVIAGHG